MRRKGCQGWRTDPGVPSISIADGERWRPRCWQCGNRQDGEDEKWHGCYTTRATPRLPHPNTITDILRRAGKLEEEECAKHEPIQRFERGQPNELWQMDFKGHFATLNGRCHPLTVLDDHSRFCLGPQSLHRRKRVHRTRAFTGHFSPVWPTQSDPVRQWRAVGSRVSRIGIESLGRLAHPPRHPSPAWSPSSSPNPGKRRTLSPHPQDRITPRPLVHRFGRLSAPF